MHEELTVMRRIQYKEIRHSCLIMLLVSFQNEPAVVPSSLPAFLASINCCDSGKRHLIKPTSRLIPAAIQKTVFQLLVLPPTPRFAQAARTYPRE
jgi:hypothetical protein